MTMRRKEWLWEGHLLRGALELLTGQPGLGKSQVQIHYMACATAGLRWPDGTAAIEPTNVIMVTAEDSLDTEVVYRLQAAKADLKRVHILKYIKTDKHATAVPARPDLEKLEQATKQIGNVGLICIDPITAYMGGKMNSHKATEVRSQLGPLKALPNVPISRCRRLRIRRRTPVPRQLITSSARKRLLPLLVSDMHASKKWKSTKRPKKKKPSGRILYTNPKNNAHVRMDTLAFKIESTTITPEPFIDD